MLLQAGHMRSHLATRLAWHSHPGYELIFLLDGATKYEFKGGAAVELHGGHFLVIPPRAVHRGLDNVRRPCQLCGLVLKGTLPRAWRNTPFTPADGQRMLAALQRGSRKAHAMDPSLQWLVRRLSKEVCGFPMPASRAEVQATLRAWVGVVLGEAVRQVSAPPTTPKEYVNAAIAYLQEHSHDTVYMADLVRHLGFSRARVFELFKAQTGLSPNEYLQRLRIAEAEKLLGQTNQSVTALALATGFGSGPHFNLVFRQYTGLSPASYRRARQGRDSLSKLQRRAALAGVGEVLESVRTATGQHPAA